MVQPNYKTRLNRTQRHETSAYDPYGMNRQGKVRTQQRGTGIMKVVNKVNIPALIKNAALPKDQRLGKIKPFAGYVAPPLQASSGTVGFD